MSKYHLNLPSQYSGEEERGIIDKFLKLDLEPIKFKMIKAAEEKGEKPKSLEELDVIEMHYKLFLLKKRLEPSNRIAPSFNIDAMWHTHILDTQKYAEDCELLFGEFLHHNPYFGMEETEGYDVLVSAGKEFKEFANLFVSEEDQKREIFVSSTCGPQPTLCDIFKLKARPSFERKSPLEIEIS